MLEALKKFIDKLAQTNREEFKGNVPDCCTINRPETRPGAGENSTKKPES